MRFGFGTYLAFQLAQRHQGCLAVQPDDEITRRQTMTQMAEDIAHYPLDGIARDRPGSMALGYDQPQPGKPGRCINRCQDEQSPPRHPPALERRSELIGTMQSG